MKYGAKSPNFANSPPAAKAFISTISTTLLSGVFAVSLTVTDVESAMVDYRGLEMLFGEPVTTSAIGKPQRVSDTAVSMEIISADEIRRSGAVDIPQILKRLAGLDVARNFRGNADVNVRGFNQPLANRLMVLINDRQVYTDNLGMTLWHTLPIQLSEIKQIEVVRGPNTSLFGFNATSGVVNIITYNPLYDDKGEVSVRVGSDAFSEGAAMATFKPQERFGFRISAGGAMADGFESEEHPSISRINSLDTRGFHLDSVYKASNYSSLRFSAGFNDSIADTLFPFHVPLQYYSRVGFYQLMLHLDDPRRGSWKMQLYRNETDYGLDDTRFFVNGKEPDSENGLTVLQLSTLITPKPDITARISTEYRENSQTGDIDASGGEYQQSILTVGGMVNWQASDNLTLTGAVSGHRWDAEKDGTFDLTDPVIDISEYDYNRNGTENSFNLGLLLRLDDRNTFRAALAKGIHIPSLVELARTVITPPTIPGTGVEVYGNPHLNTEVNTSVEVGIQHRFKESSTTLAVNLFKQHFEEIATPTVFPTSVLIGDFVTNPSTDFAFDNAGDASNYGLEFMLSGACDRLPLNWDLNYTFIRHKDVEKASHELDYANNHPEHRVNLTLQYTRDRWSFDTDIHYASAIDPYTLNVGSLASSRASGKVDSYVQLNMRLAFHMTPQLTFSLDGFNLVDEHRERIEYQVLQPSNSYAGANEIDRAVMGAVNYKF